MKLCAFLAYVGLSCFLGCFLGIFGACGVSILVWGPRILETALGSPPDRTHPAFWLTIVLLLPCVILGMSGSVALLILPVAFKYPEIATTHRRQDLWFVRVLKWYGLNLVSYATREEHRLSQSHHGRFHATDA